MRQELDELNSNLGEDETGMTIHEKLNNLLNRTGYNVNAIFVDCVGATAQNNFSYTVPEDGNYLFVMSQQRHNTGSTIFGKMQYNGVIINDVIEKLTNAESYMHESSIFSLSCKSGDIISTNSCSARVGFCIFKLD